MENTEQNTNLYSIQFVANVTGINPHTIRAWEKRYGATVPVRDKNGRRMYSDHEIQRLDLLNKLVEIGNSISDIANLEKVQLASVLEKYNKRTQSKRSAKEESFGRKVFHWELSLQEMYSAIKIQRIDVLMEEFKKCERVMDPVEFLSKIFSPLLNTMCNYSKNKIEDHDFYDNLVLTMKSKLIRMLILVNSKASASRNVLISSGIGALNELGALASAVVFSAKGFCVDFIGVNTDNKAVLQLASVLRPEIIYLSLGHNKEISINEKRELISNLNTNHLNTDIFVGGFNEEGIYNGYDVEVIHNFALLSSILESA